MFKEDMRDAARSMMQGGIVGQELSNRERANMNITAGSQAPREILQALNTLSNEVSDLINVLSTLNKRLDPVMQSELSKQEGVNKGPSPCPITQMGSKIYVEFDRVREARRMIENMLDLLEL